MDKLYYEDPYKKEFVANIVDIVKEEDEFHLVLDQTYFYPEGGGQPSDTGSIENSAVSYVYEKEGRIYHVVKIKPVKLKKVKCNIDWERRYDHMQQHLGQHILSAALSQLFKANTVGFHLSKEYSTIDIDKVLSDDDFKEAEDMANKMVVSNLPVEILYPTDSQLRKLPLRKIPPKTEGQIRLVHIKDVDINPCCGTHPYTTIEVQLIKITKWEKYKNGMRVEFLCGKRAVGDYSLKHDRIKEISRLLSVNENHILEDIHRIMKELKGANAEIRSLKEEVADYTVEKMLLDGESMDSIKVIRQIYKDVDLKYMNTLASKLSNYPNVIGLFGGVSEDKAHLIFVKSKSLKIMDMGTLLRDAITLIDGKGGGSHFAAQGGGKNNNNLESCLEYAYHKVKEAILANK